MSSKRWPACFWLILVCVFAAGFIPSPLAQEQGKAKARISGRVVSADGKPLARVTISVSGRDTEGGITKTNERGRYSIEVEPGTYSLRAERNGYIGMRYKVEESTSEATPLTVQAGQHLTNINFRLAKGGVITGRILDENGEPLVGEQVSVTPKEKQHRMVYSGRWFYTDDRGIYRIYGLPTGTYYVSVQVREEKLVSYGNRRVHMPQRGQATYYPGVTTLTEASEVAVTEGVETTGIDFRLKTGSSRGTKIFGRITNGETGEPMAGTMVVAYRSDRPVNSFQAATDDEGYYEITGLPSGTYRVQVISLRGLGSDGDLAPPLAQEVTVDREPVELNLEFERGGRISGQVTLENGSVPKDVAKLSFYIQPVGGGQLVGRWRPQSPDSEGYFALKQLPSGVYRLRLRLSDTPYYLKSVLVDGVDVREEGIPVDAGSETGDVLVVVSDAGATLRGRVVGESGAQPGVYVGLVSVDMLTAQDLRLVSRSEATSDQRGQFEIRRIRPGRYFVFAHRDQSIWRGSKALLEFLRRRQDRIQMVELKANEIKRLDVKPVAADQE